MNFNNDEILLALKTHTGKGYRRVKTKYEVFASECGKNLYIGTFTTEANARTAILNYRIGRFLAAIHAEDLTEDMGRVVVDEYVAFPNGDIFSLLGTKIKGCIDHAGYSEITLSGHMYRRHRLIAQAFVPNPEGKPFVNHINGIKTDNRAKNLEWVTRAENTKHAFRTGLQKRIGGGGKGSPVITPADENRIKEMHYTGYLDREIANTLGYTRSAISAKIRRMGIRC